MVGKLSKSILLGLLLVLCMSVATAADVSDGTANEVEVPSIDTVDESATEVAGDSFSCDCGCSVTIPTKEVTTTQTQSITNISNMNKANDTTYDFSGTFTGVNINYDNVNNVVFTSTNNDATFINSTITINGDNIIISNLVFDNTNTTGNPLTITGSSNVAVNNNNFTVYKNIQEETYAINFINSNTSVVTNNNVNMAGAPQGVNWAAGGVVAFSGIVFSNVNDSYIDSNNLTIINSVPVDVTDYSTMESITVRSASQDDVISRNKINITGSNYIYGISTSENSKNLMICKNNVTMTGTNLVSGIQLSSTNDSKVCSNKINGICTAESGNTTSKEAFAYGITVLTYTWHPPASEAVGNIICNNNVTLNSTVAYAYELSIADNTIIRNNKATVTGNVVMALGIYNSTNCNITGNTFTVTGNTTSLNGGIYEAVYPVTTGIKIVDANSQNNIISNNTITVTELTNTTTYTVVFDGAVNNNVTYNNLTATYGTGSTTINTGDESVEEDRDNIIENNN